MAFLAQAQRVLTEYEVCIDYIKALPKYTIEKPYILGLDIALSNESSRTNLECGSRRLKASDARDARAEMSVEAQGFEILTIPPETMNDHFGHIDAKRRLRASGSYCPRGSRQTKLLIYDHAVSHI
jgi:hypothetical protein